MRVTFFGHSNITCTKELNSQVFEILETLINQGANEFLLGGYGDFDSLVATTIKRLKNKYPTIKSTLVIPYLNRDYNMTLYDSSVYPPIELVPKRFAILERNKWMVDEADLIVAYIRYDFGGAATTLKYAQRKRKDIIRL